LTRYPRIAASSRQRFLIFIPYLAGQGIEVTVRSFFDDAYIDGVNAGRAVNALRLIRRYRRRLVHLLRRNRYDLLWVEKEALPQAPYWLEALLLRGSKLLLDLDDAWHLRTKASPLRRLLAGKMERLSRRADTLLVANAALGRWAAEAGVAPEKIRLAPTGLDVGHYEVEPEPAAPFTLGWIGGPFTADNLEAINAPLRRLSDEGVRLLIVGEGRAFDGLAGIAFEQHLWSEDTEASLIARCHVGINPLPDDEWSGFKSGYKLIQYMAAGRPSVASPVGANRDVVKDGETGVFACDDAEWYQQIDRLRRDEGLRRRLGRRARLDCEERFSVEALGKSLAEAIRRLVQPLRGGAKPG
jgi:glycosyltransferase involved in cell wall biosynthesis